MTAHDPENIEGQTDGLAAGDNASPGYETVSFLSDYGLEDEFVGVVHAVIASIAPKVRVLDVTHGISPHDVRAGGLALARAAPYLCAGVVLAVVDPGVGTSRRGVAIEVGEGASVLVGPDNGLLGPAVALSGGASRAVELTSEKYRLPLQAGLGVTFDGRDVFAPAAAHLCAGVPLGSLGPSVDPAALIPGMLPVSHREGEDLVAEVLWVDRFGNCQLNLADDDIVALGGSDRKGAAPAIQISANGNLRTAEQSAGYDTIPTGRVGLVVDSAGLVSLSMARRSAAAELELAEGSEVRLRLPANAAKANSGEDPQSNRAAATPVTATPVTLNRGPRPLSA